MESLFIQLIQKVTIMTGFVVQGHTQCQVFICCVSQVGWEQDHHAQVLHFPDLHGPLAAVSGSQQVPSEDVGGLFQSVIAIFITSVGGVTHYK